MIVGNGDIASELTDRHDRLYFASGVSNSQCTDWREFHREEELLMSFKKTEHVVYFSSLSILYSNTPYTRHKMKMERLVKQHFNTYCIVRIGNITWGSNPYTIINYFRNKIRRKESFVIKNNYRYILSKSEFRHWMKMIPDFNCEMNLSGTRIAVKEIVSCLKNNLPLNYYAEKIYPNK